MNKKIRIFLIFLFVMLVVVLAKYYFFANTKPALAPTADSGQIIPVSDEVFLTSPSSSAPIHLNFKKGDVLVVSGSAKGNWFFEANIPVKIVDASGGVVAQVGGQAVGEWMTIDLVPFTATFNINNLPRTKTGKIIVSKDNPSGLPEHDKSVEFPVTFDMVGVQ